MRKLLLLCLLCLSSTAVASNYGFLNGSVFSGLNKDEVATIKKSARETLEAVKDLESLQWKHPGGLRGVFEPKFSYQMNGEQCRRIRFALKKGEARAEIYHFDLCKRADKWKVIEATTSNFSKQDWQYLKGELDYTLENGADNRPFSWRLPNKNIKGVFVPMAEVKACRAISITVFDSNDRSSDGVYTFCRNSQSVWKRKSS